MIKVKFLVILVAAALIAVLPVGAWVGPDYLAGALPLAAITPAGTVGSGIYETSSWTAGAGNTAATSNFANGVVSPFGGPFFDGCGPCGFGGFGGPIGGLAQTGFGGNIGAEQSATGTATHTMAFGLGPQPGVVFGVPVPGPGGLYC